MPETCPNTFNHPDWMRAISAHIPGAVHVKVPGSGMPRMAATLVKKSWPLQHYDSWITPICNSGLPSAGVQPSVDDALALIEATESPILFRNLPVDHPTTKALLEAASQTHVLQRWQRAGLLLNRSFDDWLQTNFDQKRRKELKRLRSRLSEQGELVSTSLAPKADLAPFLKAFLALESESWKGKRGTAIANNLQHAKALEAGLEAMHAKGRLHFWQINLHGQAIASLFAIEDDGEVTLGKIAHASAYAKFSPGVLIILDATADLLSRSHLVRADSNAIPNHPMIDRIWRDRIECVDVLVAGPTTPIPVFKLLAQWIGTKAAFRSVIKRIFMRLTGRKIS